MYYALQQTYRHTIQQYIVQQELRGISQAPKRGVSWESVSILVLFCAAATCGLLAQIHLG